MCRPFFCFQAFAFFMVGDRSARDPRWRPPDPRPTEQHAGARHLRSAPMDMLLLRRCDVSAAASAFHGARRATLLLRPRTSTARIHATAPGLRLLAFRGDLPAPLGIGPLLRTGAAAFGIDLLTPLCGAAALCIRWSRPFGCTI